MTLALFVPPLAPALGTDRDAQAKALRAEFGDGYSSRARDGLNAIKVTLALKWESTPADIAALEAFFEGLGGADAFIWTAPGRLLPERWICPKWKATRFKPGVDVLTATFEKVHDLG